MANLEWALKALEEYAAELRPPDESRDRLRDRRVPRQRLDGLDAGQQPVQGLALREDWIRWVAQTDLYFGSNAREPRSSRPAYVLRTEEGHERILVAPLTTKRAIAGRTLQLPDTSVEGVFWFCGPTDQEDVHNYVWREPEWVPLSAFKSTNKPLAKVGEPTKRLVRSFVGASVPPNPDDANKRRTP